MSIVQGVITQVHGYTSTGKDSVVTAAANKQVALLSARVSNQTASTQRIGISRKYATPTSTSQPYKLYTYDNATFTQVTLPLGGATSIFDTTNNHGFAIQGKSKWGVWGATISQAQTGAPVYEYMYWNGSAFSTLTLVTTPVYTATGDICTFFAPPLDWAVGGGSGLDSNMYTLRVRATTAPTTAVQITNLWVAQIIDIATIAQNGSMTTEFTEDHPCILEAGEGIMPFFGAVPAANTTHLVTTAHVTF